MLDIIAFLKNTALVIGTKKADDAVDGAAITREVIGQIQKFTKDQKKTNQIALGPLKNFMREMYSGLFSDKETLRQDLVAWCAILKDYKETKDGGTQTQKEPEHGHHSNFGPKTGS